MAKFWSAKMSIDLIESIERDENAMERIATALEVIAESMTLFAKLASQVFDKFYPEKHGRDATITRRLTEDEQLREDQGASDESTDEWMDIGPREKQFIEKGPAKQPDSKGSRPKTLKGKP